MLTKLSARRTINDQLTLIAPDTHFGEEDKLSCDLFAKVVEQTKPCRVIQLGDLIEGGPFSGWATHKISLAKNYDFTRNEITPARAWIERILKHTNLYIQHEGNHEYRIERQALGSDFGQAVWDQIDPRKTILRDYPTSQVRWIPYINSCDLTSHYRVQPNLATIHGWSVANNAADIHLSKAARAGVSVIYGHTHRREEKTTRNPFNGSLIMASTPGCLRSLTPAFTQAKGPNDWSLGFGVLFVSRHNPRDWTYYNVPIVKGRAIVPDGREIKI